VLAIVFKNSNLLFASLKRCSSTGSSLLIFLDFGKISGLNEYAGSYDYYCDYFDGLIQNNRSITLVPQFLILAIRSDFALNNGTFSN